MELQAFCNTVKLRPWQAKMLSVIEHCDSPRRITWLVDPVGNNGKTFLSYYLRDMCQAIRVPNVNSNDVAFDYTRESKDQVNYDLFGDLKNGSIWSPKYQSAVKSWKYNVKVVWFSKSPPPPKPRPMVRAGTEGRETAEDPSSQAPSSAHPLRCGGHHPGHPGRGRQ